MVIWKHVRAADGVSLTVIHTPFSYERTLVFLNNIGTPAEIAFGLAEKCYSREFNFLTWETRGIPGKFSNDFRQYNAATHARDMRHILASLRVGGTVLVGWCGSVQIAIEAITQEEQYRMYGAILISGYFGSGLVLTTERGKAMVRTARDIAQDETKAEFYWKLLTSTAPRRGSECRELTDIATSALRESPASLLRWAHMQHNLEAGIFPAEVTRSCPVLLAAGGRDDMIGPDHVRLAHEKLPGSEWVLIPDADHYGLFNSEEVFELVLSRLDSWTDHGANVAAVRGR